MPHILRLLRQQGDEARACFLFDLAFEQLHDGVVRGIFACRVSGGGDGGTITRRVKLATQRELLESSDATVGWRGTSGGPPYPPTHARLALKVFTPIV